MAKKMAVLLFVIAYPFTVLGLLQLRQNRVLAISLISTGVVLSCASGAVFSGKEQ